VGAGKTYWGRGAPWGNIFPFLGLDHLGKFPFGNPKPYWGAKGGGDNRVCGGLKIWGGNPRKIWGGAPLWLWGSPLGDGGAGGNVGDEGRFPTKSPREQVFPATKSGLRTRERD